MMLIFWEISVMFAGRPSICDCFIANDGMIVLVTTEKEIQSYG